MTIKTRLDFLRHGEPVGGPGRFRGQMDDPLSERGWEQMRQATQGIRPWTALVSSPLIRCNAFAQDLAAALKLPLLLEPRLQEVGFGAWEGRSKADIEAADPGALQRFRLDPVNERPPGAEPLDAFVARVSAACRDIVRDFAGERLLIISHAGVMRAVFAHALDLPLTSLYRIQVGNAEFSHYLHADGRYTFLGHGPRCG